MTDVANHELPHASRDPSALYQARASDPRASAWVSANAGSGKTTVLTTRVLRLLLAGNDPSNILCLTFTKAAAAEMAKRVFDALAAWTRLDDKALAAELAALDPLQKRLSNTDLRSARTLFARALETPGGLKIQTIHAFCESLLHQFPLEADVSASFTVLDDRDADELKAQARDAVIMRAARGTDPALTAAFEAALETRAETTLEEQLDAVLAERHALLRAFDEASLQTKGQRLETKDQRLEFLLNAHGAHVALSDADIGGMPLEAPLNASPHLPENYVEALFEFAEVGGTDTDRKNAAHLHDARHSQGAAGRLSAYQAALFKKNGEARKFGKYFGKDLQARFPDVLERLEREQQRASALFAQKGYAELMTLALEALAAFEALKVRAGALDFDDLIARTVGLLKRSEARDWVRYKMDQRIDHILVDEAQDTSPQQWSIINALADEFFAGEGARQGMPPTFFAVGDEKQSIFSFQGADPRHFDGTRRALERKAAATGAAFHDRVPLRRSYRSSPDILGAVDCVFEQSDARDGVGGADQLIHEANRHDPGLVELWPVIVGTDSDEPEDWTQPLDLPDPPNQLLAHAIASRIKEQISAGAEPSDVLILLRRRGDMLDTLNRALKRVGIPVAGADRLTLTDHIAVEDVIALMRAVLLPEDDLTLATLLKSPLLGLDDKHLEALCAERTGFVIDALNGPSDDPNIREAAERFARWRAMADQATPFAFLSLVLGRDGGMRAFMRRLGEDARDPLEEVLRLARSQEARAGTGLASLQSFTDDLARSEITIKRDMEAQGRSVRIMTVHGSKGLEAKCVYLVDTCTLPKAPTGVVRFDEEPASAGNNRKSPPILALSGGAAGLAYADDKARLSLLQMQEYRRLLYVAMTRARDQLIVTGHLSGKKGNTEPPLESWYALVDRALGEDARDVGPLIEGKDGSIRLWRASPWPAETTTLDEALRLIPVASEKSAVARLPDKKKMAALRAEMDAPFQPLNPSAPLRPSSARRDAQTGADAWLTTNEADRHITTISRVEPARWGDALAFGTLVHSLLESSSLPTRGRARSLAETLSGDQIDGSAALSEARVGEALAQALGVRAMPDASQLYPTGTTAVARSEVPLRGQLRDAEGAIRTISGSIDRLVIVPDRVLAVDFKTNANVPPADQLGDAAPDYVAQMAVYAALLSGLYPDRSVQCGLLWTAAPRIDWLPNHLLRSAFQALKLQAPNTAA